MIGVEDQDTVESPDQDGIGRIVIAGCGVHHPQKVFRISELILWVHKRHAGAVFVAHSSNRWHFGNEADSRHLSIGFGSDIERFMIESRQSADDTDHDGHGVCVAPKTFEKVGELVVDHRVHRDLMLKGLLGLGRWELTMEEEITDLKKIRGLGKLFYGIPSV